MRINITNEMLSQFLSGLVIVLLAVGVGALIFLLLTKMEKHYRFTRLALALTLAPLTIIKFLDPVIGKNLYLFTGILILIGFILDGTKALLEREVHRTRPQIVEKKEEEPAPSVFVWEKAE